MTTLVETLSYRKDEFNSHLVMAQSIEERVFAGEAVSVGETSLTVRHLKAIKSGLIIHLYNIVEAIMSLTMEEVSGAVKVAAPDAWSVHTLKEWLRFNAAFSLDGNEESRLEVVHKAALKLLKKEPIEELKFKKPSGTWSDKVIHRFSQRLNVRFDLTPVLVETLKKSAKYADQTPLEFLAKRRNAIAHGRLSYEDGAGDLTLTDIKELASLTMQYLEHAIAAFQKFVDEQRYLAVEV